MTDCDRWTIEELISRYELEPSLADIYVEGVLDKEIITNALGRNNAMRAIYPIETVNIPTSLLLSHGLSEGNKQRVIVLARELSRVKEQCTYICFVDRDLDHWFGQLEKISRLRWCRHCAIELHFLSIEYLQDILLVTCKARIADFSSFFESIIETLSDLYAMRLADRKLALCLRWITFERCLAINGSRISLALDIYLERVLLKNGKSRMKAVFMKEMTSFRLRFEGDYRNHIHGHDFMNLLAWVVGHYRGLKIFASETALQRLLVLLARSLPCICDDIN